MVYWLIYVLVFIKKDKEAAKIVKFNRLESSVNGISRESKKF